MHPQHIKHQCVIIVHFFHTFPRTFARLFHLINDNVLFVILLEFIPLMIVQAADYFIASAFMFIKTQIPI
jgi:hypothetical protein